MENYSPFFQPAKNSSPGLVGDEKFVPRFFFINAVYLRCCLWVLFCMLKKLTSIYEDHFSVFLNNLPDKTSTGKLNNDTK